MAEKYIAEELAKQQREISIAEFFEKNRHLLGFDNPARALLTAVKEAVDNSLDACQDAKVLPELRIEIKQIAEERFKISVEDNGPGIVEVQIPSIFGRLLYGSKFHHLKQNRGQQGIGISAAILYGQLTTAQPAKITSRISAKRPAHYIELHINTNRNMPEIVTKKEVEWNKDHGTKIEIELEAKYQKGKQGVDEYLKQVAIVNPHAQIIYVSPENEKIEFPRATNQLPVEPKEIKPHPYGIELGMLMRMLKSSSANTLSGFLQSDFCRISGSTAKEICKNANLETKSKPKNISHIEAEQLFKAMQSAKIIAPPTDCLSPIGEDLLIKGLKKEVNAEFYTSITRPPTIYRGFPFLVECGCAFGGELEKDSQIKLLRFANRVPLLYQQGACSITEAIEETNWRPYGLQQSANAMPYGPVIIVVHVASVWVPFTSEAKEAIAHYPELIKEIKLALQECGRQLGLYIRKNVRAKEQREKINLFEKYIPELASALANLSDENKETITTSLQKMLKKNLPTLEKEENGETK